MVKVDIFQGLHPDLVGKAKRVIAVMASLGFPMIPVQGLRTTEYQQSLYAQGRTTPGHIVTNADGIKSKSNHQAQKDGYGHAIDMTFLVGGQPSFNIKLPWATYGTCAKSTGLIWGGDFKTIRDLDHLELP